MLPTGLAEHLFIRNFNRTLSRGKAKNKDNALHVLELRYVKGVTFIKNYYICIQILKATILGTILKFVIA